MYDNFKLLNYSNSLVSPELYARHLSRLFTGNVVDGLTLVPKTGLTVTLQPGNGFIPYGSGATASAREFSLVADFDITLDTADASNPRIDLIVVYVDMAVSLPGGAPTTANLDGPGVVKATFVKGTPNASPVDPTVGAIQTKIGASNPYIIVGSVRVDALVSTIAANKITDRRSLATLTPSALTPANISNTGIWWEELGRATLGAAGTSMSVTLSSPKKYLHIIARAEKAGAGSAVFYIRVNNRSGASDYGRAIAVTASGGTSFLTTNTSGISGVAAQFNVVNFDILAEGKSFGGSSWNHANVKVSSAQDVRTGDYDFRSALTVTSVQLASDTSNTLAAGAELIVLGHD
ncbi:hypothetical protein QFZ70_001531 [Arthrobacter sp. V1I9]|uniref:hypothetical protein n=1 Tax=Arthrobacter sp. V1I9 TaxID=3042275 RepID=UPI00278E81D5|nr:hypothetical protein [Arthrobacter sp. V1I9]MDQ0869058.1 hypothetical protein [Arthrobacter sp. V1I9]